MRRTIDGMVVVVTGASAGIGRAIAREVHQRGGKLALAARRVEKLEELNGELGGGHLVIGADVGKTEDCGRIVTEAVARFGRIDVVVCNAGYGLVRRVADTTPAEMRGIFGVNVFGTTDLMHAAVPVMIKQEAREGLRGHIVLVSSAAARRGLPFFGAYSATKAAQLSIAEAARLELRPQRIAVSSVHPIGTDSDFFTTAAAVSGTRIPKRHGIEVHQTPEKVARKVADGMERPKRVEIWPMPVARWGLSLATLMPRVVDRLLYYRKPSKEA